MTFEELLANPAAAIAEANERAAKTPHAGKPKFPLRDKLQDIMHDDALYPDPVTYDDAMNNPAAAIRYGNAVAERARLAGTK